jgi:hypothetical protein
MRRPSHALARVLAGALLALAAPPTVAGAQRADSVRAAVAPPSPLAGVALPRGATVRVRLLNPPPAAVTGTVQRVDAGVLVLAATREPRTYTIAADQVAGIERLEARRPAGRSLARGARRGALVGLGLSAAALGYLAIESRGTRSDAPCIGLCFTTAQAVAIVTVPVTVTSTVFGGALGLLGRGERWVPVRAP